MLKKFAIYVSQNNNSTEIKCVKEGFNFSACFFSLLWALYNRLYKIVSIILFIYTISEIIFIVMPIPDQFALTGIISVGLFYGFNAKKYLKDSLAEKNFTLVDTVVANHSIAAKKEFLSRHNVYQQREYPAW